MQDSGATMQFGAFETAVESDTLRLQGYDAPLQSNFTSRLHTLPVRELDSRSVRPIALTCRKSGITAEDLCMAT